ncbi:MAG: G-D-S-L family lipolytic protein [Eudoraea sp.]|nr:G-D-S-L family lipolytic protein [Eudoraea sp.]
MTLLLLLIWTSPVCWSQDPDRFREEVEQLVQVNDSLWDQNQETIIFTGSSSIRTWENLQSEFPSYQIINSGFGGSHASDLLFYAAELILRYQPRKVFIYEGDNDLSEGKRPGKILKHINAILARIWLNYPGTEVVLISAKPSIVRWNRRRAFKRLNRRFKRMAKKQPNIGYVDVWTPMLSGKKLKKDLFIEDGLHMNQKGYELWKQAIDPYVK